MGSRNILALTILFFCFAPHGLAQVTGAKVGDRVVDVMGTQGVVVQIGTGQDEGGYLVMFDYQRTQSSPKAMWVRTYGQTGSLYVLAPGGKIDVNTPVATPPSTASTPAAASSDRPASTAVAGDGLVKAGDRVVDSNGLAGTVVQVGTGEDKDGYLVMFDYQKTQSSPKAMWVRTYGQRNSLFKLAPSGKIDVNDKPAASQYSPVAQTPHHSQVAPVAQPPQPPRSIQASAAPGRATAPEGNFLPPIVPLPKVALPALAKKSLTVRGRAVTADGRPLPDFEVWASGHTGGHDPNMATSINNKSTARQMGSAGRLGQARGQNGSYEFKIPSAIVTEVGAKAKIQYHGKTYTMGLHPNDGKENGPGTGDFRANSETGVVRDFVLRLTGVAPGSPESPIFYGEPIRVDLSVWQGRGDQPVSAMPAGSTLTLTLVPNGPLLDGSPGQTIVRRQRLDGHTMIHHCYDIPIGDYTVTATVAPPGGAAQPLKLGFLPTRANEFKTVERLFFDANEYADGAQPVRLLLTH